jgi:hypothetical protein
MVLCKAYNVNTKSLLYRRRLQFHIGIGVDAGVWVILY